jgi:hypothetical protein
VLRDLSRETVDERARVLADAKLEARQSASARSAMRLRIFGSGIRSRRRNDAITCSRTSFTCVDRVPGPRAFAPATSFSFA